LTTKRRLRFIKPARDRTKPSAHVVADSISPEGSRLTTMIVVIHRFVLAEFNTHRVFSRNSASSRAIPLHKTIKRVLEDPAIPVEWAAERPGMQGGKEVTRWKRWLAVRLWLALRLVAVLAVKGLGAIGIHKSIGNRLLEPWMWHTIICTSTEWDGFWHQRVSPLAQPEIHVAAQEMLIAYSNSRPTPLGYGEWHRPLSEAEGDLLFLLKQSAACCARVSTNNHDGRKSHEADEGLFDKLYEADPMHASPFEHQATPDAEPGRPRFGNLYGWDQWRHHLEDCKAMGQPASVPGRWVENDAGEMIWETT
jgi:hypothetical protein